MLFHDRGIIVAADLQDLKELQQLVVQLKGLKEIAGYKIGFSLALRYGLGKVVETIKTISDIPVIYDHQKAGTDIPQTGELFAQICKESKVDGVILFPHSGPETLNTWLDSLKKNNLIPIIGAIMTHPRYLVSEGGWLDDVKILEIYGISLQKNVEYFIVPGTKPNYVNQLKNKSSMIKGLKIKVLSPGFGRQKADIDKANEVFIDLEWYPIIGSAIYKSEKPDSEARLLAKSFNFNY